MPGEDRQPPKAAPPPPPPPPSAPPRPSLPLSLLTRGCAVGAHRVPRPLEQLGQRFPAPLLRHGGSGGGGGGDDDDGGGGAGRCGAPLPLNQFHGAGRGGGAGEAGLLHTAPPLRPLQGERVSVGPSPPPSPPPAPLTGEG